MTSERTLSQNLNFKLHLKKANFHINKKENDTKTKNKIFHINIDSHYLNTSSSNNDTNKMENNFFSQRNNISKACNKKNLPISINLPIFNINITKNPNELLYIPKNSKLSIEPIENKKKINFNKIRQLINKNTDEMHHFMNKNNKNVPFNKVKKFKKKLEIDSRFNQPIATENNFICNENIGNAKIKLANNYFSYENFNDCIDNSDRINRFISNNNSIENISIIPKNNATKLNLSKNEKKNIDLIAKHENSNSFVRILKINNSIDNHRFIHNNKIKLPSLKTKKINYNEILSKRNMKKLLQNKVTNIIAKENGSIKRKNKLIRNDSYLDVRESKKQGEKTRSKIIVVDENSSSKYQSDSSVKDNENMKEKEFLEMVKKLEFKNEELVNLDIFDVNDNDLYAEYDYKFEIYFKEKFNRKNKNKNFKYNC